MKRKGASLGEWALNRWSVTTLNGNEYRKAYAGIVAKLGNNPTSGGVRFVLAKKKAVQ